MCRYYINVMWFIKCFVLFSCLRVLSCERIVKSCVLIHLHSFRGCAHLNGLLDMLGRWIVILIFIDNFYLALKGILGLNFINFHSKCKNRSNPLIRNKADFSVKLLTNIFANTKAESDSLFIQIFIILNCSKHFEKF